MSKKASIDALISIFDGFLDEDDILSSTILSQISSKIVKYRIDKKMNQKQFADFLGVSQSMISKIESSDYNFTIKNLVKLCNKMDLYLNLSIDDKQKTTTTTTTKYYMVRTYVNESDPFVKKVKYTNNFEYSGSRKIGQWNNAVVE